MILTDRFWAKIEQRGDCWYWTGATNGNGYGQWAVDGRSKSVHRLTFEAFRDGIPNGLTVDHLCHDSNTCRLARSCPHRRCANPWHMELVPATENSSRVRTDLTHCKQGHALSGANLILKPRPDGRVHRNCRTCRDAYKTAWDERRRAAA